MFEAGEHKWNLCFYPTGNSRSEGNGHISLYLKLAETESLLCGWKINAKLKFFVFDQLRKKYLAIQDGDKGIRHFDKTNTEWGLARLLSLETFTDLSKGYLVNDCCILGAEVLVIKKPRRMECFSLVKKLFKFDSIYTWNIDNFSALDKEFFFSEGFTSLQGTVWRLLVYLKGHSFSKGEGLSVYLHYDGGVPSNQKVYAEFKLRVKKQYANKRRLGKRKLAKQRSNLGNRRIVEYAGIRKFTRDFPPSHYLFKVESFSLLAKTGVEKYESDVFEAAGHKWRLLLYPNGNNKSNGSGFLSLYLVIDGTENLPHSWEVNVSFRLFVLDQIRDKYLTIEDADGAVKRFHWMKTEWGFAQLVSIESFNDTSNGYLVGDCCIFGAEVFLMERNCKWECLSMVKEPDNNTICFHMDNFSKLDKKYYESAVHTIGDSKWKLTVYPKGNVKFKGKALSVFLELAEADKLPPKRKVYAEYKLRVRNQINDNHMEFAVERWFSATSVNWGYPQFMPLKVLYGASKGFIVYDSLIVEAEITLISSVKRFS